MTINNIVIFGAHGKVGQHLICQLTKAATANITAVVRNQEQAENLAKISNNSSKLISKQLTVDEANVSQLTETISGNDAVVFTSGSRGKELLKVDLDGAVKVFEASVLAKVRRLILVSAIYADNREMFHNSGLRNYYISKHYADRILKNEFAKLLDFTILKPSALTDGEATGKIHVHKDSSEPVGSVTRADVAGVIVEILEKSSTYGKSIDFSNGEESISIL